MKIKINLKKCLGCGTCIALAPNTFTPTKKGKAEVITDGKKKDSLKVVKEAVSSCPNEAITLEI